MMQTILFYLALVAYNLLFLLAAPVILLRFLWRSLSQKAYRQRLLERFGWVSALPLVDKRIWIHAVSVGEVAAAVLLIRQIQQRYPDTHIVVTTTTPTGAKHCQQHLGKSVTHYYLPLDMHWCVQLFLHRVKPTRCFILETEIWPNIINGCARKNIPIALINARLSKNSFVGYKRFGWFFGRLLESFESILVQSAIDYERFIGLGVAPEKCHLLGNLKFDYQRPSRLEETSSVLGNLMGADRVVCVAASTHAGEEKKLLSAFKYIASKYPKSLLVLIPRHPERFDVVAELLKKEEWMFKRRSDLQAQSDPLSSEIKVLLVDTMGEVNHFFGAADIAFVGGSLVNIGGHNVLEAAAAKLPIVVGPHMDNFLEITNQLKNNAAIKIVDNIKHLQDVLCRWIEQPALRAEYGQRAYTVVENNQGVVLAVVKKLFSHDKHNVTLRDLKLTSS